MIFLRWMSAYLFHFHQIGHERRSCARPEVDDHGEVLHLLVLGDQVQELGHLPGADVVQQRVGSRLADPRSLGGILQKSAAKD